MILEDFEKLLDQQGFFSLRHPASESVPFPHLTVKLEKDEKDRERLLYIKMEEDVLSLPLGPNQPDNTESFVQIYTILPFDVPRESIWEVLRILNFFNKSLPTPCFLLDEDGGKVYCRYSFVKPGTVISAETLFSLLGMMSLWIDTFSESIEQTALGTPMANVIENKVKALIAQAA